MKELTSYNRVAGYLNKVFDLLNAEFFESAVSKPPPKLTALLLLTPANTAGLAPHRAAPCSGLAFIRPRPRRRFHRHRR